MLIQHYRKLRTPKTSTGFDMERAKEINAWATANLGASKREDSGPNELQREFRRDYVKECVAKLESRRAAGVDEMVFESKGEWE